MEEENGELRKALNILILGIVTVASSFWSTAIYDCKYSIGLNVCKVNEALLTRVIKLHERLQRYEALYSHLAFTPLVMYYSLYCVVSMTFEEC